METCGAISHPITYYNNRINSARILLNEKNDTRNIDSIIIRYSEKKICF